MGRPHFDFSLLLLYGLPRRLLKHHQWSNDIYLHLFDRQLQFIAHLLVMSRELTNLNSPSWCCSSAVILPTGRLNLFVKYSGEVTTGYRQTHLQFTKIHVQHIIRYPLEKRKRKITHWNEQHQSTLIKKYTCHDYINNAPKGISSFYTCVWNFSTLTREYRRSSIAAFQGVRHISKISENRAASEFCTIFKQKECPTCIYMYLITISKFQTGYKLNVMRDSYRSIYL